MKQKVLYSATPELCRAFISQVCSCRV